VRGSHARAGRRADGDRIAAGVLHDLSAASARRPGSSSTRRGFILGKAERRIGGASLRILHKALVTARGLFAAANFDPYGRYILSTTLAGGQPRIGSLSADLLRKLPSVPRSLVSAARPIRREESTP